nr:MAG TPA: putative metallopeptidase [Bacteriophage sp.]
MNIPNKVRIQGLEYSVEQIYGLSDGAKVLAGEIWHMELRIRLQSEQAPQRAAVTLWHEILHAVVEQNGLKLEDEEHVVDTLAFAVHQILEDNVERFYPRETKECACGRGGGERIATAPAEPRNDKSEAAETLTTPQ